MIPLELGEAFPVALAILAGCLLVMASGRLVRLGLLAIQYIAVAWLSTYALPASIASVKAVAGLLACGILVVTLRKAEEFGTYRAARSAFPAGRWFSLMGIALALTTAYGLVEANWLQIPELPYHAGLTATVLMGLGLLQVGFTGSSLRVGTGLMTLISGFEIAYSSIEPSLAVLSLLGSLHLGFALVISYLLYSAWQELEHSDQPG